MPGKRKADGGWSKDGKKIMKNKKPHALRLPPSVIPEILFEYDA
jgi:hypothetical protein